ncbi:MAG: hypothetical protein LBD84_06325 [Campylobacteraceae bacterium]|jgi:hypothetical protein|nr:hypothetical protein [Campylobacteraceae bacterium]
MKKFIKIFLLVITVSAVLLIALVYGLLFTQAGNNILKPIIEKKVKEAGGIDIKLDKFSLRFNSIDVEAVVLNSVKAKAAGGLNLFSQTFDINYSINADKLPEVGGIKIDEPLTLNGQASGGLKDINVNGIGDIFGAALNFDAILRDFKPIGINIDTNGLKLAKVLALLGQPIYADGTFSAKVHINPNEKNELSGDAVLYVNNGIVHKNILKKEFNVTLKEDISYKTSADLKLSNSQDLVGMVDFASSLANFKATNVKVNISTFEASSTYRLDIPNLKQLESLAGIAFQGAISFYGNAKYAASSIQANVNSDNLADGKLTLKLDNDKLDVSLTNAKIAKILHMLVKPSYTDANLDVKAKFSSLVDKTGVIDIDLTDGLVNNAVLKKEFNLTLPRTDFSAKSNITLKKNTANFNAKFLSALANLEKFEGVFDIGKTELKSTYLADIKDLSKFNNITGQKMRGSIKFDGEADYKNGTPQVNGKSSVLGGNIKFNFENNEAFIGGADISALELLNMLSYPQIFDAKIDFDANYNINTSKGNFNAVSSVGHMTKTQLGDLVETFSGYDITKEEYNNSSIKGTIDSEKIRFAFDAKSKKTALKVTDGKIAGTALDIPFSIRIEKTDIAGRVAGTSDKPKVSIDSSKYLQDKAVKEIDKYLEKNSDKIEKALNKLFK